MILAWVLSGSFIIFLLVIDSYWEKSGWLIFGAVLIGLAVPERVYFENALQGDDIQGIVSRVFTRCSWIKYYFYCYGFGLIGLAYYSLFGGKDWFEDISTTVFFLVLITWLAPIVCFRQYELFIRAGTLEK